MTESLPLHLQPKEGGVLHLMSPSHTAPVYPLAGCREKDPRYARRLGDATCRRCLEKRIEIARAFLPWDLDGGKAGLIDRVERMLAGLPP